MIACKCNRSWPHMFFYSCSNITMNDTTQPQQRNVHELLLSLPAARSVSLKASSACAALVTSSMFHLVMCLQTLSVSVGLSPLCCEDIAAMACHHSLWTRCNKHSHATVGMTKRATPCYKHSMAILMIMMQRGSHA